MLGALLAAGVPPWFMVAHSAGETFEAVTDADGRPAAEADRTGGAVFKLEPWPPPIGPGSWPLAFRTSPARTATPRPPWSAAGSRGASSRPSPCASRCAASSPSGWGPHPGLWVVACDYATGRRVAFGRPGAPPAELADAVAASCAIPGFYRPVEIGGRRYVDGGMYSTSNLDLLRDEGLDLVICLNPTSSLHPIRAVDPREWGSLVFRRASGRRLGSEAKKLRARGTPVVLVQPTGEDLRTMSRNLMSTRNRNRVIEVAHRTVAAQLRDARARRPARRPAAGAPREGPPAARAAVRMAAAGRASAAQT